MWAGISEGDGWGNGITPCAALSQRQGRDVRLDEIPLTARIDNPEMGETQFLNRDAHGAGEMRRLVELEFHAVTFPMVEKEQIQLRAGMGSPKIGLRGA
jgi:hypothetical protein